MRKRFISALAAAIVFMFFAADASAADSGRVYSEIGIFKAQVYVCDDVQSRVILRSVTSEYQDAETLSIASEAEYNEIPINADMVQIGGAFADLAAVNTHMLDKTADVVIGRNSYGLKVLYMRFN